MATKTNIELKIVDSVDTSHSVAEVLADSASNPDAFYVGRGYLAHNGEKVIESIDEKGTYPNVTVGNATKATTATTADKAVKDGSGKNIAENYALISDTVGKLGVLNSPADRSAAISNALTNAWGIDNTLFSVIIYERANSSATWVEKWNYTTASVIHKAQIERGEFSNTLFTSTRGYQVRIEIKDLGSAGQIQYIKTLGLYLKTKDASYSGNVDYTAYYGDTSLTAVYNGSTGTWGAILSASFIEKSATSVEYIFNTDGANAVVTIKGYRICTQTPANPTLIGKALKAYEADKATTADTATTAVNISEAPVLAATEEEQITVKVGNKTSNALTVPYAQHAAFATDLSGRVEATPEIFTYRPSAGDKSIKDDNAFIRRVKGNSVVWNNQAIPLTADYEWYTNTARMEFTFVDGVATGVYVGAGLAYISNVFNRNTITGHKYYRAMTLTATKGGVVKIGEFGRQQTISNIQSNVGRYDTIFTSIGDSPLWGFIPDDSWVAGDVCSITNILDIDLTQMFGTGNEPTVEEFRALYPNTYYPYNAGELRNLSCFGIRTVGFNQWNGNAIVGYIGDGTGAHIPNAKYKCTDYIRIIPTEQYYVYTPNSDAQWAAWYDENKTFIQGITSYGLLTPPSNARYARFTIYYSGCTTDWATFCINLHHTGYRDGEYAPYKEVTHALPLSKITNGEPLRKAGGEVYDEINETEYIRRVGVRGYATGDKDDATLITDGRYTNYPLDEPIVKPIETPIDLGYYVEDFGTEEALLTEDSAPFSADIIYQFNATDQVRNNARNIQRLKKSAFTPSGSTSQYIRGDGSYADVSELARVIPIYDGEEDHPEDSPYSGEFCLFPQQYAKLKVMLDGDSNILVRIEAPENRDIVAEYWLEIDVDESRPTIEFVNSENDNIEDDCRFNGEVQTFAKNIWHIITTDGGTKFMGEIKNYVF